MRLKDACVDAGQYGVNVSPEEYRSAGLRMLRTSDLADGGLSPDDAGVFLDGPIPAAHLLKENDLLLSRAGTIGRSYLVPASGAGITFAGFLIRFRPRGGIDPRFLHYCLRSKPTQDQINAEAVTSTIQNFNAERYANLTIPDASEDEQRRIADFLDDRVARIDRIITARQVQVALLDAIAARASYEAVTGANVSGERRSTDLAWLGDLPSEWPLLTVASQFQVDLGKMLDEKRQTGEHVIPYLRNTNVQWDTIDADDLKTMDIAPEERSRYTVKPGDLLICEGGQPGRGAIWTGSLSPLGYQKALHRARTRGRSRPAWLLECLRTAVSLNVFAIENEQTTIGHLTNEQLRSLRFPFPDPEVQDRFLADVARTRTQVAQAVRALRTSTVRLGEFKQSLITAAVTGEIDVSTASSGIPG